MLNDSFAGSPRVAISNTRGVQAVPIAEHVMAVLLDAATGQPIAAAELL